MLSRCNDNSYCQTSFNILLKKKINIDGSPFYFALAVSAYWLKCLFSSFLQKKKIVAMGLDIINNHGVNKNGRHVQLAAVSSIFGLAS